MARVRECGRGKEEVVSESEDVVFTAWVRYIANAPNSNESTRRFLGDLCSNLVL